MIHWFLHYTGTDAPGSRWYNFWSGFGSDLGELTLIAAIIGTARHKNCHVKGCWRLGHPDDGLPACRLHHSKGHK